MSFDPSLPANGAPNSSAEMRSQFVSLFDLIQAIPAGPPGPPGPPINHVACGPVTQVNPGDPANAQVTFDGTTATFYFSIPRGFEGAQGIAGSPGEVTSSQLNAAIANTSANSNAVTTLDTAFVNDPPTLADIEVLRAKMNELILALRR